MRVGRTETEILDALREAGGRVTAVPAILGRSRRQVYTYLDRFGLREILEGIRQASVAAEYDSRAAAHERTLRELVPGEEPKTKVRASPPWWGSRRTA